MKFQTQQLTDDMNLILDVFVGADGGVDYIKLRSALISFEQRAMEGDESSKQIIQIVRNFAKLIEVIININLEG
jgi:hypothetical protein